MSFKIEKNIRSLRHQLKALEIDLEAAKEVQEALRANLFKSRTLSANEIKNTKEDLRAANKRVRRLKRSIAKREKILNDI